MNSTKRQVAERRGRSGERRAMLLLLLKGYRILGTRVRTPQGEIDLVAKAPSGLVCFVEVKARDDDAAAVQSLGPRQRGRIARAASLYLAARPGLAPKGVRFDVVTVSRRFWPRHARDVWRGDGG